MKMYLCMQAAYAIVIFYLNLSYYASGPQNLIIFNFLLRVEHRNNNFVVIIIAIIPEIVF